MAVGDLLLARFKHAVATQLAGRSGAGVSAALAALALLAQHAEAAPLLESLLAWRAAALSEPGLLPAAGLEAQRRRATLEGAFWEAVQCLAGGEGRPPPAHVAEALESEAAAAAAAADGSGGDPDRAAAALGVLSRRRFEAASRALLSQLEARAQRSDPAAAAEAAALCRALSQLRAPQPGGGAAEAAASAAFLRAASPARWAPARGRVDLSPLLCAGLAAWLGGCAGVAPCGSAHPAAPSWAEALGAVRSEHLAWLAKAERRSVGAALPLAAALLCAEVDAGRAPGAAGQLGAFVEGPLARALKERHSRLGALDALRTTCAWHAAALPGAAAAAAGSLWAAVAATLAAVPASLRRAGGDWRADAEPLAALAAAAVRCDPAAVMEAMLPDLVASRADPPLGDCAAAGLRALLAIIAAAGGAGDGLPGALRRLRAGGSAVGNLGIGGALPASLRAALSSCARAAVTGLAVTQPPAEAPAAAAAQIALLSLLPFCVPDEWRGAALPATLLLFSSSSDTGVRAAACGALCRTVSLGAGSAGTLGVRPLPLIVAATLEFAARAAEKAALSSALGADVAAALELATVVVAEAEAHKGDDAIDAPRCQAAVLALAAASPDAASRRSALALLAAVARLDAAEPRMSVWDALCGASLDTMASLDQAGWSTTLGSALRDVAPLCSPALLAARPHALRAVSTAADAVSESSTDVSIAVEAWRQAAILLTAGVGCDDVGSPVVKALFAPLQGGSSQLAAVAAATLACATPAAAAPLLAEAAPWWAEGLHRVELRMSSARLVRALAGSGALGSGADSAAHALVAAWASAELDADGGPLQGDLPDGRRALCAAAAAMPPAAWPAGLLGRLFAACSDAGTIGDAACARLAASHAWNSDPSPAPLAWASAVAPRSLAAAARGLRALAHGSPCSQPGLLELSYAAPSSLAIEAFLALADGVTLRGATCPPASLLAAAFLRLCDGRPGAQTAVRRILAAMAAADTHLNGCVTEAADSFGAALAVARPAFADAAAGEVLSRLAGPLPGLPVITIVAAVAALPPWLARVSLARGEASASAQASKTLPALLSLSRSLEKAAASRIWSHLAQRPPNAAAALEFLLAAAGQLMSAEPCMSDSPELLHVMHCAAACASAQPREAVQMLAARALASRLGVAEAADAAAALALLSSVTREHGSQTASHLHTCAPQLVAAACCALQERSSRGPALLAEHFANQVLASLCESTTGSSIDAPVAGDTDVSLPARLRRGALNLHESDAELSGTPASAPRLRQLLMEVTAAAGSSGYGDAPSFASLEALREAVALEALRGVADAKRGEEAVRCAAMLQALARPLRPSSSSLLCECTAACLSPLRAARAGATATAFAEANLTAFAAMAAATSPSKLGLLHPSAFWAAAAALRAPAPHLAQPACDLLLAMLRGAPSGSAAAPGCAEEVLLMAAPALRGPPAGLRSAAFPGLSRLALRAACVNQVPAACALLARLAALSGGGAADVLFGEADSRCWLALGGALPWLLTASEPEALRRSAAGWLAEACTSRRGGFQLATALQAWPLPGPADVSDALAAALTGPAAALLAAALLALLRSGPPAWAPAVLALLTAVFEAPCGVRPPPDLAPLAAHAAGAADNTAAAQRALAAALRCAARPGGISAPGLPPPPPLPPLWPEPDAEAAMALLSDVLSGAGAKRRDAPAFLFAESEQ